MAEKLRIAVILSSLVAATGWADVLSPSAIATPAQPQWSELTVEQKVVLAPLGYDWDAMDYPRRKKWLGITRRFFTMMPEEQRRIQGQMQNWGQLTPEQRRVARENFLAANKLPVDKKQELRQKWEEYSSLPEEEKERLKQEAARMPAAKAGPASGAPGTLKASPPPLLPPGGHPPAPTTTPGALPANATEAKD